MSTEENKALARRFADEVWNTRNLAAIDHLTTPTFRAYLPGSPPLDREGFKQFAGTFCAAFPDLRDAVADQVAEGDTVVTRRVGRGTHQGAFQGIPPTGKPISVAGINLVRVADGKLAELHAEVDLLGLLQQLGVIPAPAPATG